jgi:hypothetical protein
METGQGAGGANGQGDGQQQGGEGADSGPDFAAMQQALSSQGETLESMRDFLQSAPWQDIQQAQGQEAPQQDDPFGELDLGILDPDVAAGMDPQQFSQQLSQTISQAAEQIADRQVEQRVGPVEQQLAEMQRQQDVASLVGEFPEIAEEDTAKQVLQAAGQLAEQMGQPELGQNPKFWRVVYMAGRAADAAAEEQGDISAPVGLESGAGATPGGGGGDLGDQIVGARAGRGVLPF